MAALYEALKTEVNFMTGLFSVWFFYFGGGVGVFALGFCYFKFNPFGLMLGCLFLFEFEVRNYWFGLVFCRIFCFNLAEKSLPLHIFKFVIRL